MIKNIDICFVCDTYLFDNKYLDTISEFGQKVFLNKCSFSDEIIKNKNKKIIIYDPDFGGWNFPKRILEESDNILAIFLGTTDTSYIDFQYCMDKNIKVFNIPKYATDSVAEYLIMYMFACAKKIPLQIKNNYKQEFTKEYEQIELIGKNVGIIGLGNIGSKIANICNGIGMNICYWDRKVKDNNYKYTDLKTLFCTCDVIYLCLSISDETKNIVSDTLLNSIKKNAIFISCTGKNLFNFSILEEKVKNNEIFGYAFEEANPKFNEYEGNIMVTSEYGWFTKEASESRINIWFNIIIEYLNRGR